MKIRPGAAHPLQNLEKKHLSKNKLYELYQSLS